MLVCAEQIHHNSKSENTNIRNFSTIGILKMKKWFKFLPLILLVGYFITYDVVTQVESTTPSAQTSQQ